jgi:hypothetical protein
MTTRATEAAIPTSCLIPMCFMGTLPLFTICSLAAGAAVSCTCPVHIYVGCFWGLLKEGIGPPAHPTRR